MVESSSLIDDISPSALQHCSRYELPIDYVKSAIPEQPEPPVRGTIPDNLDCSAKVSQLLWGEGSREPLRLSANEYIPDLHEFRDILKITG